MHLQLKHQVLIRALFGPVGVNPTDESPSTRGRSPPKGRAVSASTSGAVVALDEVQEGNGKRSAESLSAVPSGSSSSAPLQTLFTAPLDKFVYAVYALRELYHKV